MPGRAARLALLTCLTGAATAATVRAQRSLSQRGSAVAPSRLSLRHLAACCSNEVDRKLLIVHEGLKPGYEAEEEILKAVNSFQRISPK
jgi:hypothetical protein